MTPMAFGLPGGAEWLLLLVVALLIFGGTRLAGLGRGAGQAIREFKEETRKGEEPKIIAPTTSSTAGTTVPQVVADPEPQVAETARQDPPRV